MEKRPLFTLLVVLIAAAATWWWLGPATLPSGDVDDRPLVPDFNAEQVARIEVEQLLSGVWLKHEGNSWQVAKKEGQAAASIEWFPADGERVTRTLALFNDLKRGIVVSRNPDHHARYRVDTTGQQVRLFDASLKKIVDVVIGKNGPDGASNYVRLEGTNDVLLSARPLTGIFSIAIDDWREKPKAAASTASPSPPPTPQQKSPHTQPHGKETPQTQEH